MEEEPNATEETAEVSTEAPVEETKIETIPDEETKTSEVTEKVPATEIKKELSSDTTKEPSSVQTDEGHKSELSEKHLEFVSEDGEDKEIVKSKSALRKSSILYEDNNESKSSLGSVKFEDLKPSRSVGKSKMAIGRIAAKQSVDRAAYDRKTPRYMNTYRLWSDNPFNPEKVTKILETVMTKIFEQLTTYDANLCVLKAKQASTEIKHLIKDMKFDRYKIICLVTIGEKSSQLVTTRGLWDIERDRYAFFTIENVYLYGIAQCYGIYYE